ncbi:hypothetical protein HKD37_07G019576 [Glycine soja]
MKADMEAMKEQMAAMMEAMMSVKKIMEANAVTIVATSTVAKVNPMPPSGLNQMNHPTLDMVGKDLGSRDGPHNVQNQNKHAFPPYGLSPNYTPPNVAYTPNEDEIPHHNLADFEPCLGYAIEGQAVGGIPLQNPLEGPQYHPQLHLLYSTTSKNPHAMAEIGNILLWKMVGYTPSSLADLVFVGEMIEVGLKRGKFSHPAWTNEKTGANEEGEDEGEACAVTAIPIQPSFPPTQQSQSKNTKQEMNFAARKPVEFTPIPVSYADLLPYLFDNSMVAITPTKVHQPPFLREYDSNATCACHGEASGHSIEHCRALKRKVQGLIDVG